MLLFTNWGSSSFLHFNIVNSYIRLLSGCQRCTMRWKQVSLMMSPEKRVPTAKSVTIREYKVVTWLVTKQLLQEQCRLSLVRGAYHLTKNPGSFALVIFSNFRWILAVIFQENWFRNCVRTAFWGSSFIPVGWTVEKFFSLFQSTIKGNYFKNYKRLDIIFGQFVDFRKTFHDSSTVVPTGVLFSGNW